MYNFELSERRNLIRDMVPIPLKSSSCSDLFRPAVPKVIDQSFRNIPTR